MTHRLKILLLSLFLLLPSNVAAQISIPNSFSAFTVISAASFNTNFEALGDDALDRTGGTLTGNMIVNGGVTIDGVDISTYLLAGGKLKAISTAADSIDVDGGITAGSGNVAIVDITGKIPALSSPYFADLSGANLTGILSSVLSGALPNAVQDLITRTGTITSGTWSGLFGAVSGANLTTLNAANLASGTVPTARLGTGSASASTYLRGDSTWQTIAAADLSNLNATNLTSGTVPDARFPATLPALSGANLTTLNASNLSSGTVASARLSSTLAYENENNTFSGNNTIDGVTTHNGILKTPGFIWVNKFGNPLVATPLSPGTSRIGKSSIWLGEPDHWLIMYTHTGQPVTVPAYTHYP